MIRMKRLFAKFFILSVLMFGWHFARSFQQVSSDVSVIDILRAEHYLSNGSGMRDGRKHIEYEDGFVLGHKTVNPFAVKNQKTAQHNFSSRFKKQFSSSTSSFVLVQDSRNKNIDVFDEFQIHLSYETSGLLATVNRLFTIGSIRC